MGAPQFRPKMKGSWMKVQTQTCLPGKKVTFDCKEISAINSDLATNGLKGYAAAFCFEVTAELTVPIGGAALRYNTMRQRGCVHTVEIEQPGNDEPWWTGAQQIAKLWLMSQIANLPFALLVLRFLGILGETPSGIINLATKAVSSANGKNDALLSAMGWADTWGPAVCLNNTGAPIVQAIDDFYPLVPCLASRRPRNDVTPLHYWANDKTSVKFRFTGGNLSGLKVNNVDPSGLSGVNTEYTEDQQVTLWVFVVPIRVEKDQPAIGVSYCLREVGREGPTIRFDAGRRYRFAGLFPKFDFTSTLDNGLKYYYQPAVFVDFATIKVRWQRQIGGEWRNEFPLLQTSGDGPIGREIIDQWNELNCAGWERGYSVDSVAPILTRVATTRTTSNLSDRIAGLLTFADLGISGFGLENFIGELSFIPVMPYAMSAFHEEGFPGFGTDDPNGCEPRIQFDPDTRPDELVTELWVNGKQRNNIIAKDQGASMCGCAGSDGKVNYVPDTDNPKSSAASIVKNLVPFVGLTSVSTAIAAPIPAETPAGVINAAKNGK